MGSILIHAIEPSKSSRHASHISRSQRSQPSSQPTSKPVSGQKTLQNMCNTVRDAKILQKTYTFAQPIGFQPDSQLSNPFTSPRQPVSQPSQPGKATHPASSQKRPENMCNTASKPQNPIENGYFHTPIENMLAKYLQLNVHKHYQKQ